MREMERKQKKIVKQWETGEIEKCLEFLISNNHNKHSGIINSDAHEYVCCALNEQRNIHKKLIAVGNVESLL